LRAVIMNSLFLLTWGYMSESVRSSALLGVPVAALMILLQNPAMAVDPSFTLSFMAILALALMTQPFFDLFKRLQGNDFAVLVILLSVLTWAFAAHWFLVITWRFWIGYLFLGILLFVFSHYLTRRGVKPLGDYGLANVPAAVAGFFAAQFGIQIGMMFPLSPFYFSHWPVAGAYANLIAIPLVGIVLQLSMLAGLLGLIPGIGIYLALVLSAANWIFSIGFLLIGHYFSRWFIYPFMIKPTVFDIGFYFCMVSLFVWWKPLWFRIIRPGWRSSSRSRLMVYFALLALVGAGVACKRHAEKQLMRPDGKLEVSVLFVGYASGIFVDTPDHHAILIDTGLLVTNPTYKVDAERTILPFIYSKQISQLDSLVVTSPKHEYSDGLWSVLFYIDTKHFFYPAAVAPLVAQPRIAALLEERSAKHLKNRLSDTLIAPKQIAAGDVIYQSEYEGKPILVEAVGPAPGDDQMPLSVRIQYGNFSMLIPSDLNFEQQKAFLANTPPEKLKVDVVVAPHHGTAGLEDITVGMPDDMQQRIADISGPLYKATDAKAVIFEFGNPRSVEPLLYKEARKIYGLARRGAEDALPKALNVATDTDGAIQITSDGSIYHLYTQLSETGTEVDEPSLLEIGGW